MALRSIETCIKELRRTLLAPDHFAIHRPRLSASFCTTTTSVGDQGASQATPADAQNAPQPAESSPPAAALNQETTDESQSSNVQGEAGESLQPAEANSASTVGNVGREQDTAPGGDKSVQEAGKDSGGGSGRRKRRPRRSKRRKKDPDDNLPQVQKPDRRKPDRRGVFYAGTWKSVDWLHKDEGDKWDGEDIRMAWKRCVVAHLDVKAHSLLPTSPVFVNRGRRFLSSLKETTLKRTEVQKLTAKQARDIGWASGKQYAMDAGLRHAVHDSLFYKDAIQNVNLPELVPVMWAMVNAGQYPEKLFDYLVAKQDEAVETFNLQNCTNTLWAMGCSGYHPGEEFVTAISELAATLFTESPDSAIPQAVSDFWWSLGRLGHNASSETVHRVLGWAYERLDEFNLSEIAATGVGLAMCDALGMEDMRKLAEVFQSKSQEVAAPPVFDDQMLMLTLLFPAIERSGLQDTCFGENKEAVLQRRQEQQAQIAVQMRGNKFLQRVCEHLEKVGAAHKLGVLSPDRNLAIELLVSEGEETYAVIPVYPTSKNRNGGQVRLGETNLARRLIEAQGLKFGGILEWTSGHEDDAEGSGGVSEDKDEGSEEVESGAVKVALEGIAQ